MFIGALGGAIYTRVPKFLGLDPTSTATRPARRTRRRSIPRKDESLTVDCANIARRTRAGGREGAERRQDRLRARVQQSDQYDDPLRGPGNDGAGAGSAIGGPDPGLRRGAQNVAHSGAIWRGAPSVGDDTTDVLTKLLRLPEDEIADLYRQNIVHRTEPFETPQVDAVRP